MPREVLIINIIVNLNGQSNMRNISGVFTARKAALDRYGQ